MEDRLLVVLLEVGLKLIRKVLFGLAAESNIAQGAVHVKTSLLSGHHLVDNACSLGCVAWTSLALWPGARISELTDLLAKRLRTGRCLLIIHP